MITEYWPPMVGGIENYLWHVAQQLASVGHEVTVVAPKIKQGDSTAGDLANRAVTSDGKGVGVKVIRKKFYGRIARPRWWRLYKWIKKKARQEKYDMVLCGKGLFEGMVGYLLQRSLGVPYAIFSYGMEIECWMQDWRNRNKLSKVARGARVVFCINEQTEDSLKTLGVAEKNIVKAWPGVDEALFKQVTEEEIVAQLKKYDIRRPYVISVGRLIERKGFDVLIEAFGQLDQTEFGNTKLVIVGDGPMLAPLQDAVEKELIDSSVLFLPDVPDDDLPALYAGASLFAMTPRDLNGDIEGFGLVYMEAAAQGTPAVATRTGGVPEAVIDGGTGIIVEPENADAIKKAMGKLLKDKALRDKMGATAKRRAAEEFNWQERIKVIDGALRRIK